MAQLTSQTREDMIEVRVTAHHVSHTKVWPNVGLAQFLTAVRSHTSRRATSWKQEIQWPQSRWDIAYHLFGIFHSREFKQIFIIYSEHKKAFRLNYETHYTVKKYYIVHTYNTDYFLPYILVSTTSTCTFSTKLSIKQYF